MSRRSTQIRIEEQNALIDKARKRNAEIEIDQVKRVLRIAETQGLYDTPDPEALIKQAIKKAVKKTKAKDAEKEEDKKISRAQEKHQRELRVHRQNRARIERANRSLRRLKIEARRIDASQKWRLGHVLQLAKLEIVEIDVLDKTLETIVASLTDLDSATREKWTAAGSDLLKEHEDSEDKNTSGQRRSPNFDAEKADAHRKISLGGLIKKHQLDAISPALLLGALLDCAR